MGYRLSVSTFQLSAFSCKERMDAISSFGSWVRRRRRLLDLTQVELAQHVHCSVVMIKKIEHEERGASHQMAQQLARALVLPPSLISDFVRAARFELAADCLPDPHHLVEVQHQPSTRLPATRLPVPPTPFIGREAALETLCTMVQTMRTRLITLIGPPGIGKTRLALAAAEQLQASFPGGVVFVDMAAITDEAAILSHIASAFGVAIEGEQPIIQHLDRSLHEQNTLVLIDNCEHLAQVAYIISDLLSHVMHLRIMATSREPLRLCAEQRFELSSMSVPPLHTAEYGYPYSAV